MISPAFPGWKSSLFAGYSLIQNKWKHLQLQAGFKKQRHSVWQGEETQLLQWEKKAARKIDPGRRQREVCLTEKLNQAMCCHGESGCGDGPGYELTHSITSQKAELVRAEAEE